MAANLSPSVTVTVAAAEFAQPVATPATLPASGGSVVISGTTSDPDGTSYALYLAGADTTLRTTSSGGAYAFPAFPVPANTALSAETLVFTVGAPPS
jgi:hypothetical protein